LTLFVVVVVVVGGGGGGGGGGAGAGAAAAAAAEMTFSSCFDRVMGQSIRFYGQLLCHSVSIPPNRRSNFIDEVMQQFPMAASLLQHFPFKL
jgi:hypothetical protein